MVEIGCISFYELEGWRFVIWHLERMWCPTFFRYVRCRMLLRDVSRLVVQHDF